MSTFIKFSSTLIKLNSSQLNPVKRHARVNASVTCLSLYNPDTYKYNFEFFPSKSYVLDHSESIDMHIVNDKKKISVL